jgi:hypothetical protein
MNGAGIRCLTATIILGPGGIDADPVAETGVGKAFTQNAFGGRRTTGISGADKENLERRHARPHT